MGCSSGHLDLLMLIDHIISSYIPWNADRQLSCINDIVRKWSQEGGRGAYEVLPLRKRRTEKVLPMLKGGGGGHKQFWGSFYMVA